MAGDDTKFSSQSLDRRSFSDTYGLYENLVYGYDPVSGTIKAIKVNSSGAIDVDSTLYKQIEAANDNVTTINYTSTAKTDVSTIVQSSVTVGATATKNFDNSGATSLVITRVIT